MASASAGCNTLQRLSDVGGGPELSQIANPTARPSYRPVSLPMPAPRIPENNISELARAGGRQGLLQRSARDGFRFGNEVPAPADPRARAFFKDQRANEVGDILTVKLDLDDSATLANKTERERDDAEDADLTGFLGLEDELSKKFPQGIDAASVLSFGNKNTTRATATSNGARISNCPSPRSSPKSCPMAIS